MKVEGLWNFAEEYMASNDIEPTFWDKPGAHTKAFKALASARRRPPHPSCREQSGEEEDITQIKGAKIYAVPCQDRHFQAVPSFYTNFEVVRLEILRSSWYQDWFTAVDKTGSIFYNRWGDAPIRFIGLSMHLPPEKIINVKGCGHK